MPRLVFGLFAALVALSAAGPSAGADARIPSNAFDAPSWRLIGPHRAGWGTAVGGIAGATRHVLFRRGRRWGVEDDRRRTHVAADLRPGTGLDRCDRDRAVGPEGALRRHRAGDDALRRRRRRRHVQVERWRADVVCDRTGRHAAHRIDLGRSGQCAARAGRRARPRLRTQRRTWRVSQRRRRRALDTHAVRQREHRRGRRRRRSRRTRTSCSHRCGRCASVRG